MADEKKTVKKEDTSKAVKKTNIFKRIGKAIAKFFKDLRGETKKIVWPGRQMVIKSTGIVLAEYTPYTLLGSYYKMMKKFNCGANFLITQTGWDMLKLQSLAWYLTGRDMHYPKIARLTLLSPERLDTILNGGAPGIKISKDMKKLLDKELVYSKNQFEATQYRRLELQAAGCRLLGFSGIEISGADNPAKTGYVLSRISTA